MYLCNLGGGGGGGAVGLCNPGEGGAYFYNDLLCNDTCICVTGGLLTGGRGCNGGGE